MSDSGYTYLASPYTHASSVVRHDRYLRTVRASAALMAQGYVIFSPIAHSHNIELLGMATPQSGAFWKAQDEPLLRRASQMIVLKLDGWEESLGIKWEIDTANAIGIPVKYLDPAEAAL